MKQVFMIIRPNMYFKTKDELTKNNFLSMSVRDVTARFCEKAKFETPDGTPVETDIENPFVAKKMIEIICRDDDLERLVDIILNVNKTGHEGDGMIYIMDIEYCERIRTGETGVNAIM